MSELLTSGQWCESLGLLDDDILDPDGWDRANFRHSFYEELISYDEFRKRVMLSTVNMPHISKAFAEFSQLSQRKEADE
jgi:hypothetical protein